MKLAFLLLISCTSLAQQLIGPIAHVGFRVADLEKTRAFYAGKLQLPQAYDQKDPAGKTTLVVFMVNDNQFLEFSQGSPAGFTHVAYLTERIEALHQFVASLGLNPPELRTGRDRTRNFSIQDPDKHRIEFVQHEPDSMQAQSRGKFPRTSAIWSIAHLSLPTSDRAAATAFFRKLITAGQIEFLPAGSSVRIAFVTGDEASGEHAERRDPDGIGIDWTSVN